MKYNLSFILFIFSAPCALFAQSFDAGVELYRASQYHNAITVFSELDSSLVAAPEVQYNLGNCYFKLGDLPQAIVHYERALKADPSDADAAFNLALCNARIADKIPPVQRVFVDRWWHSAATAFSPSQWGWWLVAGSWMVAGFAALFLFGSSGFHRQSGLIGSAVAVLFTVLVWLLASSSQREVERNFAVVKAPTVTSKSEPNDTANNLFVVHEGLKVEVIDRHEDWRYVTLADGNRGWMPASSLIKI